MTNGKANVFPYENKSYTWFFLISPYKKYMLIIHYYELFVPSLIIVLLLVVYGVYCG